MNRISGSVGKQGKNRQSNVKLVQQLLNRSRGGGQFLLRVDGYCGPRTISAIEEFQLHYLKFRRPDGVVEPSGPTIAALSALAANPSGSRNLHSHANTASVTAPRTFIPAPPTSVPAPPASVPAPPIGLSINDKIAWGEGLA